MMSLHEIRDAPVNVSIAREAHEQASVRLADVLDTKKTHEQKAYTLFTGYITLTLALMGAAGAIWSKDGSDHILSIAFGAAGAAFALGAICFVLSLHVQLYGAAGSNPSMWLVKGTIDGDEKELARMLAYVTFHHEQRIRQSVKSNNGKARWLKIGILLGALGPILLAIVVLAGSYMPLSKMP